MILSVHQPQYIPWLGYFDKIAKSDCFVFLDCVQYKDREYQNRNRIRTKDGELWLTVPVLKKGMGRQVLSDVRIDDTGGWRRKHCNSLRVWYGGAAFFNAHFPFFERLYAEKWDRLLDLNMRIINYVLKELEIHTPVYFESDLNITGTKTGRIVEICKKLNADVYLSGAGGRDYLEEEKFAEAGVALEYQDFVHPAYRQQYTGAGNPFIPCMSSIDLLFNEGKRSMDILKGGLIHV